MKTKLKILFVSQYFHPEQFSNNSIAQYLSGAGHEVEVVTCVPNYPEGKFFDGYSNRELRQEKWGRISINRAWTVPRGKSAFSLIRNYITFPITGSFKAARNASDADVSFVSMPSPLFQAFVGVYMRWRRKIPTVFWVQDLWPETVIHTLDLKNPLVIKPLTWICGWLYRQADLVLVQSEAFIASVEKFGVPANKIRVYPNSAPDAYRPLQRARHPKLDDDDQQNRFQLMFAGNIGESQDFDTIIACAERLKDHGELEWVIVGSGRDQTRVEREVEKRGLQHKFKFLGRHPEGDMPELFAQADAMLVTLKSNPVFALTVPYKVQCYMACGKPIIAALDGEGARIISEAKAGISVPASNPAELAEAVLELMALNETEVRTLGKNARAYYLHHYDAKQINANLENWLKEAVDK